MTKKHFVPLCLLLAACLAVLPAIAGATPQGVRTKPSADASENSYQLKLVNRSAEREASLELLHADRVIARKAISQASEDSRLAAAMTPDGARVAFLVVESDGMASLWLGDLREPQGEDVRVERLDTAVDQLASYSWDLGGTRLAYAVHRGGAGREDEDVMTEIWLWDGGPDPWMAFSGQGRLQLAGWTASSRVLLRIPDGTAATFDPETAEYQVAADMEALQPVVTQVSPRVQIVVKGANNADVIPGGSSVPSSIAPSQTKAVSVQVYNNGSSTWTYGTLHRLGAEWSGSTNQVTWSGWNCGGYMSSPTDGRAYLCNNVSPGSYYTFYFNITASSGASGSVRLAVRMVQDGVEWFGESYSWNITVSGGGGCPNSPLSTLNDRWKLEIWNNRYFSGGTVEQRYDAYGSGGFAYNWGSGRPSNCTGNDNYAVRFSRSAYFPNSTTYTFTTRTDDGVRLWVDGVLIIDRWIDQAPTTYTANRYLGAGYHDLRMDYYENGGGAVAELSWASAGGACPGGQYDVADYVLGDSPNMRVFSRMQHNGAQEEFGYLDGGTVGSLQRKFFIKNASGDNWEEFGYDSAYLYRYRDTSWGITCDNNPSANAYYGVIDDNRTSFAKWAPRCMYVGQVWFSDVGSRVDAGYKNWNGQCGFGCTSIYEGAVWQRTKLQAYHSNYTTIWGVNVPDVIELTGVDGNGNPTGDHFWYAKAYGLVGFEGPNPSDPANPYRSGAYQIDTSGHGTPNRVTLCGE